MRQQHHSCIFPQRLLLSFFQSVAFFTTHINTQLPPGSTGLEPCHHHNTANLSPWQCDWQALRWMPVWANGISELGCHACDSLQWFWRTSWAHNHIAWAHWAAQSTRGPYSACHYCLNISFMSLLCGLLLEHVDRGIILAFDTFPYIHRVLITHISAPFRQALMCSKWEHLMGLLSHIHKI